MMKNLFHKALVFVVGILFIGSGLLSFTAVIGEDTDGHDYYFVQFSDFASTSQRESIIQNLAVDFHEYYQDNKYLARINDDVLGQVKALPLVDSVVRYSPDQKVHEEVTQRSGAIKLWVTLHNDANANSVVEQLETMGAVIKQINTESVNFIRCSIDASLIDDITTIRDVKWIQQEFEPETFMNLITTNTYMGHDTPQPMGWAGGGVLAEVCDNGIDLGHLDLSNVQFWDFGSPVDSHGTCTSGIVFGNGFGDMDAQGIMYQAVGVFADWFNGNALTISNLWDGTFTSGDAGQNGVMNSNSWYSGGTMDGTYDTMSNELDQAIVDHPHVLTLWACGNSNQGTAEGLMSRESISKNDVSVGAIFHQDTADMGDDQWELYGMGNTPCRGPAADGRVKPDMCAPFDWIYTTDVRGGGGYASGDYYDDFGGTSGACPIVAGSSGLIYDMWQGNFFGTNPTGEWPYSSTVKAILIADAQQYPMSPPEITRNVMGWGTPDMENLYNLGEEYHVIEEYPQALDGGDSWSREVFVDGSSPLKVTTAWIDPAAPVSTGSGRALINNLDLKVISPTGTEYWGNSGLETNVWSSSGTPINPWGTGHRDDLNNVENVFVQFPTIGVWTIEVQGRTMDVAQGPQDFSIVASGAKGGFPPYTNVTSPNGFEDWQVDSFHDITWDMMDYEDPATSLLVTLDYSTNGGVSYPNNIIFEQTGFGPIGTYNWQIPNTPTSNAKVRITVTDTYNTVATDESDQTFFITVDTPTVDVTSPDGGESLMGGGNWEITWTAVPGTNPLRVNPISIDYSTNGPGGPWNPIVANEPNDGTYTWDPIPTLDAANCYVWVGAEDDQGFTGYDVSNSNFEIDSTAPAPASNPYAELTGTHVTVYWDASPTPDVDHYQVYYAMNNWDATGDTYGASLAPVAGTSSQHLNVGINNGNSYFYQVRTFDDAGNEARTMVQAGKISGWFMLGSFLVQSDTSLGHVIQGQGFPANWDAVQRYDSFDATDPWKSYIEGRPASVNDLSAIDNTEAFWLHLTGNSRWTTAGYVTDMSINLKAGWNMVPYPFVERQRTAAQIQSHLSANCPNFDTMMIADYAAPYRLATPSGAETLLQGAGFWVRVTADTTWSVTNY